MRSLAVLCAVVGLLLVTSLVSAADVGQVSHDSLSKLGLAGLQPMTDVQGDSVRGSGVSVWGSSFASSPGANANNAYSASGRRLAAGGSISLSASGAGIFPLSGGAAGFVVGSVSGGGAIAVAR